mgnify:CR=1 FL=1
MAEKRTIDININTNADEAAKEFDNVAKAVNVANDSLEGLNKTFEEANGDIQPLTARMGEAEDRLYELAAAGDTASAEYQGLLNKVGEYRKVQISTDLAVDQAAGTLGQKLGGALTGAASGFAAVQGVMALTGSESEALEKSLLKVQGAMAFQQGIQGVLDYSKSVGLASKVQKAFNLILNANPLALLVTALIAVIGYFAIFTDGIDIAIQALKDFGDFIGLTDNAGEAAHEAEMQRIEEAKKAREDSFNELQSQFDREIKLQEALGKSSFELTQQKIQNSINFQKQQAKELEFALESLSLNAKGSAFFQKAIEESTATIKTLNESIEESENQLKINILKNNKEKTDSYKEYASERLSQARKIQDLENSILEEGVEKEVEISRVNFERLIADVEGTAKEKKRLTEIYLFQQQEAENEIRNRFRQEDLKAEEEFQVESMLPLLESNAQSEIDLKRKTADAVVLIDKDKAEKEKQIAKDLENFKLDTTTKTLGLISGVAELFGKKSEKAAKRAFNVQKAASIALATIETYKGARAIFASTAANPISIANPSAPFIAAGVAVASGLLEVANIASQKFEGGGSTDSGGTSAPSLGGGGAPNFNVVGDSGVNQLATLQQQPTQAYVVSGDVTTAQALDRNRVQNATL